MSASSYPYRFCDKASPHIQKKHLLRTANQKKDQKKHDCYQTHQSSPSIHPQRYISAAKTKTTNITKTPTKRISNKPTNYLRA